MKQSRRLFELLLSSQGWRKHKKQHHRRYVSFYHSGTFFNTGNQCVGVLNSSQRMLVTLAWRRHGDEGVVPRPLSPQVKYPQPLARFTTRSCRTSSETSDRCLTTKMTSTANYPPHPRAPLPSTTLCFTVCSRAQATTGYFKLLCRLFYFIFFLFFLNYTRVFIYLADSCHYPTVQTDNSLLIDLFVWSRQAAQTNRTRSVQCFLKHGNRSS